jgi:hypothetical protein
VLGSGGGLWDTPALRLGLRNVQWVVLWLAEMRLGVEAGSWAHCGPPRHVWEWGWALGCASLAFGVAGVVVGHKGMS